MKGSAALDRIAQCHRAAAATLRNGSGLIYLSDSEWNLYFDFFPLGFALNKDRCLGLCFLAAMVEAGDA